MTDDQVPNRIDRQQQPDTAEGALLEMVRLGYMEFAEVTDCGEISYALTEGGRRHSLEALDKGITDPGWWFS